MNLIWSTCTTFKSKEVFVLQLCLSKRYQLSTFTLKIILQTLKIKHVSRKTNVGFWLLQTILTKQNQNFCYYQPTGSKVALKYPTCFQIPQQTFLLEGLLVLQKMKVLFSKNALCQLWLQLICIEHVVLEKKMGMYKGFLMTTKITLNKMINRKT